VTDTLTDPDLTLLSPAFGSTATVLIRYFAGARAAAGVAEERVEGPSGSVADVLDAALARRGPNLARVLPSCSFLLNGVAVRDRAMPVPDGAALDVLPPFAGG
jgi:molybdopterin converting factor small subunit